MHRRRVFRVATAYAVVSFILLQIAEITFEPLQLPPWALTALILGVVLLFPVVMALAWVFDLTPQGIQRTEANENSSRARPIALLLGVLALDGVAAYFLYTFYSPTGETVAATQGLTALPDTVDPANVTPAPEGSVAVLPFVDLSESDQGYFAEGIAADIHSLLGRCEGIQVPGFTSSRAFAGANADVRAIGSRLNVASVLEGTVRKEGDRLRVTAQLIAVDTGFTVWSSTFDSPTDEVLAIQEEIVTGISLELTGNADILATEEVASRAPASYEAFDRYLEGRGLWRQRTPASLEKAIEVFKEVIALDPQFAPAHSGLADSYLLLANYGNMDLGEAVKQATPHIYTALDLDGELSEAYASLGLLYWNLGRTSAAEGHLRRAITFDEENAVAYVWLGGLMGQEARLGEQEAILRQGLERDPLHLLLNINLSNNLLSRGRIEEGFGRLEETRDIFPDSPLVLRTLAAWQAGYGRVDEALDVLGLVIGIAPDESANYSMLARILMSLGNLDGARLALEQAQAVAPNNGMVSMARADYLWRTGRRDGLRELVEGMLERTGDQLLAGREAMMPEYWLGRILLADGEPENALDHFGYILDNLDAIHPQMAVDSLTWVALAHRNDGDPGAAERRLAEAERRMGVLHLQGMAVPEVAFLDAVLAAMGDDRTTSLAHLAAAADSGWYDVWTLENDARLASLRSEADFRSLVNRLQGSNEVILEQAEMDLVAWNARANRHTAIAAR